MDTGSAWKQSCFILSDRSDFFCCILTFEPAQNAIQGDAPEGSDTFQWQLGEEIAWGEIGKQNGTS